MCAEFDSYLSGVILHEETLDTETINSSSSERETIPAALKRRGILVGVKVDAGLAPVLQVHVPEGSGTQWGRAGGSPPCLFKRWPTRPMAVVTSQ